jgi:hypothetical protein
MATQYAQATTAAGPHVIEATLIIPIALSIAFAGLVFYMRSRKNAQVVAKAV